MKTILNLAALRKLMKSQPIGQRLWLFFKGFASNLSKDQCQDMISILEKEHKKNIAYIKKMMEQCTN